MAKNAFSRYAKADDTTKQRIIGASFGEPGTGKTTFWLTAPGPIVVMSFDRGLEGVVEEFTKTKDVYVDEYEWAPAAGVSLDQQEAIDLREKFTESFEHAIQNARTVVLDKETDVWGLFKFAEFGVSEKGVPQDWDSLKGRLRRLYNMPKTTDVNFGIIQGMKNEWIPQVNPGNGKKGITQSGRRLRAGMDDIEGLVHLNIEHERIAVKNAPSRFVLNVGKSRGPGSRDVQDQTFENLTFPEFAQLVFPESSEQDWQ